MSRKKMLILWIVLISLVKIGGLEAKELTFRLLGYDDGDLFYVKLPPRVY